MPEGILKTKLIEAGEVFTREDLSREYDADSLTVANATANPIILAAGYPMNGSTPATAAQVSSGTFDGVVVEPQVLNPNSTTGKVAVFKRGTGIVINQNQLPQVDTAGSVISTTWYTSKLASLGFVCRSEPSQADSIT